MDAALGFGGGDALDAVDAAFVFEAFEDVVAGDAEDDFFEATEVGGAAVHVFDFPAATFGVAGVHAVEVGGEEGGFVAAGTGANFDDRVAGVGGVGRGEAKMDFAGEDFFLGLEEVDFFAGELGKFAVGRLGFECGGVFGEVGKDFEVAFAAGIEFLEARVFAGEFLGLGGVVKDLGIAEGGLDAGLAAGEFFDVGAQVHG